MRKRIAALRAARIIRRGGLLAHATGTVAGVAADPFNRQAMRRLMHFKGRCGPFLLLAASPRDALRLAARRPASLRRLMRERWPGPVTLVYPATPRPRGLPLSTACVARGRIAARVDADDATRLLCRLCGGLLASSSLNRRGRPTLAPDRRLRWRWHRHLDGWLAPPRDWQPGRPSAILALAGEGWRKIRA